MDTIDFTRMPNFEPLRVDQADRALMVQQAMDLLLHSRYAVPQDALISLEINRIFLGNGGFVVTGFRPVLPKASHLQEVLLNLEQLANQVYDNNGLFYVCQMDGQVIVISCFPQLRQEQCREAQINDLTVRLAQKLSDLSQAHWGIPILAAVGPLSYGLASLSSAFFFVTELVEYKQFLGNTGQLLCTSAQIQANQLLHNTREIQQSAVFFANKIYSDSLTNVEQRVTELLQYIAESEASSMRNFHFCLLLFVQALTAELRELGVANNQFLTRLDILGRCYAAQNLKSLNRCLCGIFREIEENYAQQSGSRMTQLIRQAKDYIDSHFTDSNLSVAQAAELVGIHQSTLSTMFRQAYGETIVNYIRALRVEKAKELLTHPELNLSDVAQVSGFGSLNTMYRAFRAREGLPPGKLR